MNKRVGSSAHSKKAPLHPQNGNKKTELQRSKSQTAEKTAAGSPRSTRERKLALLQDVDNLKKKLRQEENVHRALERAFNRPLGTLPRLPPYLPQSTLELLAEVAVLEEEVVRLEECIVDFRQGLYQEAVYISSKQTSPMNLTPSKKNMSKQSLHSRSSSQTELELESFGPHQPSSCISRIASTKKLLYADSLTDVSRDCLDIPPDRKQTQNGLHLGVPNGLGNRIDQSNTDSDKDNRTVAEKRSSVNGTPMKRREPNSELLVKNVNSPKTQCRTIEQAQPSSSSSSDDRVLDIDSEANKMSEDILKCLINIFVRLSSSKGKTMDLDSFSSLGEKALSENNVESNFRDPYRISTELKKMRDIGTYKHLFVIEARSVDSNRKTSASFLIRRLKILLDKLASVKLDALSHQQKLAFWINIYNSCIMNAYLEHGIPKSPDMIVVQMQKATIKVGGHVLNAVMIEHLILRLSYHLKYTCSKSTKNDERKIRRTLGLEWSEPLVTFALSCGSWSSPAVRVYTASQIEKELETAKRDYLQAAIGISASNKLVIPKLLDWYLLDFAKDLEALLDWICLQLPDGLRNEALKCLERRGKEPISKLVQVAPYNFSFRYLVYR